MAPKYRAIEINLEYKQRNRIMLTTEEYKFNLKKHSIESIEPCEEYKGSNSSIEHICKIHNYKFKAQPNNILHGSLCPICQKEKKRENREREYIDKLNRLNIPIKLDDKYISSKTKVFHICKACSNRWKTSPELIFTNSYSCPNCAKQQSAKNKMKSPDWFSQKIDELFGKSITIIGTYNGERKHILSKCNICNNTWNPFAYNLLKGSGCPFCKNKRTSQRCRKTIEQYKKEVESSRSDIIVLSNFYETAYTPLKHQCVKCNYIYYKAPNVVLQGWGKCPVCNNSIKMSDDEYKKKIEKTGKNIELLSTYTNSKSNIVYRCLTCNNEFSTQAGLLLINKYNCPNCAKINTGLLISDKEFLEKVHKNSPNIETLYPYNGSRNPMDCKCLICGEIWTVKYANKLYYSGCPRCNLSKLENNVRKYLKENDIKYNINVKFDELRGVNNGMLSYDVGIIENKVLIECQGRQHEEIVEYFGGLKSFIKQQIHDIRKRKYAKENGIKLITIWYNQIDDIPEILNYYITNLNLESLTTAG